MRLYNIGVLSILESHILKDNFYSIMRKVFPNHYWYGNYDFCNDGRILVVWDASRYDVQIKFASSHLMHCVVRVKELHCSFQISFVYASNDGKIRESLWKNMIQISSTMNTPWCCMGDFNVTLSYNERKSKTPPKASDIQDFAQCLHSCSLVDLHFSGPLFTWSNR